MSAQTTADESRDGAQDHIDDAVSCLASLVIEQVYGWDDYSEEYRGKLRAALMDLLRIQSEL